jgi:hypothetical protein
VSNDANRGALMLNLYCDVHEYVAALRAADVACATKAEMQFICDMRIRWSRHTSAMRITWTEQRQLLALAARGGWNVKARLNMGPIVIECSA